MPTTKNMRLHPVNISVYLLYAVLLLLLLETALSMQLPENIIAKKLDS